MVSATDHAMTFLQKRGIDPQLAKQMGWDGFKAKDGGVWLRIPYRRAGVIFNHKYRRIDSKEFRNDTGVTDRDLFNVDCLTAQSEEPLIVTEGEIDCLSVMQAGFKRVVSVPDGWTNKLEDHGHQPRFAAFDRNANAIAKIKRIIVAADDDDTGKSLTRAIGNLFADHDVRYVQWPAGSKDANDVLREWGPEYVAAAINDARPVFPPGGLLADIHEGPPEVPREVWKLGVAELDKRVAFRTREISVLTGRPGSGKSTFALWAAYRLVEKNDIRVALAMFETSRLEALEQLATLHGRPKSEWSVLGRNYKFMHRLEGGNSEFGMRWLKQMIRTAAGFFGCRLIIVDPWNELEHMPLPGEQMTYYVNAALTKLRQWAERYDIHILVVAHPRKLEDGQIPYGYSVDGSAAWFNKAGMGYTLHMDPIDHSVSFHTWKVRSRQQTGCDTGCLDLVFNSEMLSYSVRRGEGL